jgi:hypothetical protein
MLRRVALVRNDFSEEHIASIIRVLIIGKLETTLAVSTWQILATLLVEAIHSSKATVLTRATRRNVSEDDILDSHHREYFKSYIHGLMSLK